MAIGLSGLNSRLWRVAPGLILSLAIAAVAGLIADRLGGPVMLLALLLGMALNFLAERAGFQPGIALAARTVLRIGVALLGFRITLWQIAELGWQPVVLVVLLVTLTVLASIMLARRMGFDPLFGLLTGGASAICGASAALAISAAIPKRPGAKRDTAFTVMGVSILSTIVMILYPAITGLMGLDDRSAGIFIGASIHDVAQVVGAGYAVSGEAGDAATIVKLMRVGMLAPLIVAIGLYTHRSGSPGERPPILPLFVAMFLLLVAANSIIALPASLVEGGNALSRGCLVTAIAALGLKTRLSELAEVGWKPGLLMVGQTVFIALLALVAILPGWV